MKTNTIWFKNTKNSRPELGQKVLILQNFNDENLVYQIAVYGKYSYDKRRRGFADARYSIDTNGVMQHRTWFYDNVDYWAKLPRPPKELIKAQFIKRAKQRNIRNGEL